MNYFVFMILGVLLARPGAEGNWRWSNPRPHGNNILDIEFSNGVYWQIGDRGQVYTSMDAALWIPRKSGTSKSLRAMTSFKGKVYMVGAEGTIVSASSVDSFQVRSVITEAWLEGIAASSEHVVAVADDGAIYASSDGEQWTRRGNFDTPFTSVACIGNTFVAVGENGLVVQSNNATEWTTVSSFTTQNLNGINAAAGRFWITGNSGLLATNLNRMSGWKLLSNTVTNDLFTVAGNNSQVIVGGDGTLLLATTEFDSWMVQTNGVPEWPLYSSCWDGDKFLVGGRSGMLLTGTPLNGGSTYHWDTRGQESRSWLWSVASTPQLFLATGASGTILTSENGYNWSRESTPSTVHRDILMGVAGNGNVGVAVGSDGAIIYTRNAVTNWVTIAPSGEMITNSLNLYGLLWQAVAPRPTTKTLQGLHEKDGLFVAAGAYGTILVSPDGESWSPRLAVTQNTLSAVGASLDMWVATGDRGTIITSPDTILWTARNSGVTNWIYSVAWFNSQFLAVGEGGILLRSEDGRAWQSQNIGTTVWLNDIAYLNGKYYIFSDQGFIATSTDTTNWNVNPAITIRSLYSATVANNRIIAVGTEGTILSLRNFPSPVDILDYVREGPVDNFLFGGEPGQYFQLQRSTLLPGNWTRHLDLQIESEDGTLDRTIPSAGERSFFRTFAQP